MAAGFGNIPPFFTVIGPASATSGGILTNGAQTIAGAKTLTSALTISVPEAASAAETFLTAKMTGDSVARFDIKNNSAVDGTCVPILVGTGSSTNNALGIQGIVTTDTGASTCMFFQVQQTNLAAVTTRSMFGWFNVGVGVLTLNPLNAGADAYLRFPTSGAGVPTFTARAAGTKMVWLSLIDGTHADFATGIATNVLWNSVPQATSTYSFDWYGGTTKAASLRGDGLLTTTGGKVRKTRTALTTPVTVAVTDDIVEVNLTTPGAVTINYPSSPTTGTEFVFQDGKGDAGANNHTHTPAAGNINGAGTKVYATNYYRATAYYNGTQWLIG